MIDREQAFLNLIASCAIERRYDCADVGLSRRWGMEARRNGAAECKTVANPETRCNLAIKRTAEVREILVSGCILKQYSIADVMLDIGINSDVVALELTGVRRFNSAEAA